MGKRKRKKDGNQKGKIKKKEKTVRQSMGK